MDNRLQKLFRRLRSGPYDKTALKRIKEEIASLREHLSAKGEKKSLQEIVEFLISWSQSATDKTAASLALFEAGIIAETDLNETERARQLYVSSMISDATHTAPFYRFVELLVKHKHFEELEVFFQTKGRKLVTALVNPSMQAEMLRKMAVIRSQHTRNIDGAIEAYLEILQIDPEISDVKRLAELLSERGHSSDTEQIADLYYTLGDIMRDKEGIRMLSKALDVNPVHEDALLLLEELIPQNQQSKRLKDRWSRYLKQIPDGPSSDARRRALAQALGDDGCHQEGIEYLTPLVEKDDATAKGILQKLENQLKLKRKDHLVSDRSRLSNKSDPKPSPSRRIKKTIVGYKLEDEINKNAPQMKAQFHKSKELSSQQDSPAVPDISKLANSSPDKMEIPSPPKIAAVKIPSAVQGKPPMDNHPEAFQIESSASPPTLPPRSGPVEPSKESQISNFQAEPEVESSHLSDIQTETEVYSTKNPEQKKAPNILWITIGCVLAFSLIGGVIIQTDLIRIPNRNKAKGHLEKKSASIDSESANIVDTIDRSKHDSEDEPPMALHPQIDTKKETDTDKNLTQNQTAQESSDKEADTNNVANPEEPLVGLNQPKQALLPEEKTPEGSSDYHISFVTKLVRFKGGRMNRKKAIGILESSTQPMKECYAAARERKPRLKGRLTFVFTVKRNGRVTRVKKVRGTIKDFNMTKCMIDVIGNLRFRKPKRRAARVQVPIVFKPSN